MSALVGIGYDSHRLITGRRLVLGNADVRISYAVSSVPSPLYRNAIGDESRLHLESHDGVTRFATVIAVHDNAVSEHFKRLLEPTDCVHVRCGRRCQDRRRRCQIAVR